MAKKKRPRIGIVPRLTLGTAAAVGIIPACVAMSCSSSSPESSVFGAFDSSYQNDQALSDEFSVFGAFDSSYQNDQALSDSGAPSEAEPDADDATSGDAGSGDGPASDAIGDGSNEGG